MKSKIFLSLQVVLWGNFDAYYAFFFIVQLYCIKDKSVLLLYLLAFLGSFLVYCYHSKLFVLFLLLLPLSSSWYTR